MSLHTVFDEDVSLVTKKAGAYVEELCSAFDIPTLLLVSGGSALDVLEYVDIARASHLTIGMLDERYTPDSFNNNFQQFQKTSLYTKAHAHGATFIDTSDQTNKTMSDLVFIMENTIRNWKRDNPTGKIYIVEGVGGDGHTAGIMPFPEDETLFEKLFEDSSVLVVGYDAKDKNPIPLRITVTLTFLRDMVDEAVLYVVGDSKSEILKKIIAVEGSVAEMPAKVVKEMKSVTLFTDIQL